MTWTRIALSLAWLSLAGCGAHTPVTIVETPASTCEFGPEDVDGFEDDDACADLDDDHDGIPDARDACPCFVEDMDGFEDADGCPEVDNDQDRNLDACDDCPDVNEVYNGYCDADGCPDRGAAMEEDAIVILEQIEFEARSETVMTTQRPIVDAVASTLNGNPQLLEVAIIGHATRREGLALAETRARTVRDAMIALGVDAARLTMRGEITPRARNVTFEIVRIQEGPEPAIVQSPAFRMECPPEPETWCTALLPVPVSPSCSAERGAPSMR
jgi:outer membrane protein OmpA-like peptidoglycan-associated protein